MKRYLVLIALVGLAVITLAQNLLHAPPVKASTYGLAPSEGYFTHVFYPPSQLGSLMDGVSPDWANRDMTVDKFIANMLIKLNEPTNFEAQNTAVSAIVLTMMGVQSTDPRLYQATAVRYSVDIDGVPISDNRYNQGPYPENYKNGVGLAHYLFPLWARILRDYDAGIIPGASVNWNANNDCLPATLDGFGVHPLNPGDPDPNEFAFSNIADACDDMIVFNHPDGTQYMIKKYCGNLTGDEAAFPVTAIDYALNLTAKPTGGVAGVPLKAVAGVGQAPLAGGVGPPGGYQAVGTIPVPGAGGPNWYWNVAPLPGGFISNTSPALTFTVPAGTPALTLISFEVFLYPGDSSNGFKHVTVQFLVNTLRDPAFIGENADIHAGGKYCDSAVAGAGSVKGYPGGISNGDFVIAASGSITDVRSNGAVNPDDLKLGGAPPSGGGYSAEVCRPNLIDLAAKWKLQHATGWSTSAAANFTLGTAGGDLATADNVYFLTAPTVTIHGVVSKRLSIVASGNVIIDGNITDDPTTRNAMDMPSLGIIANGDITILPAAIRVDGYLFAGGTAGPGSTASIYTCGSAPVGCATNLLTVNGFLMGSNIYFQRLGASGTNGHVVSERITLTPQLYLNPPQFFDATVDGVLEDGQGERQPLF